ncbi:MAG: hypothetical protein WD278_10695 [Pirellulales bacterium]
MPKVKYVLLVPLDYNDGTLVSEDMLTHIEEELYLLAGGFTVAGEGRGAYRMKTGEKQVDRSLQFWVVVDEGQENALRELVSGFGAMLGQESMYLERTGSTVEFVPSSGLGGLQP